MVNFNVNESFGNGNDGVSGEQSGCRRNENSLLGGRKEEDNEEDANQNGNFSN